jgi:hypothetical protein
MEFETRHEQCAIEHCFTVERAPPG